MTENTPADFDFPNLALVDLRRLQELENDFGRERVLEWNDV